MGFNSGFKGLMARYQGLYHTNEKNVLLNRYQELDSEDDTTIFPSFPSYWVNNKSFLLSANEKKKTIIYNYF